MIPAARITVWKADMSTCYARDAVGDCPGGSIQYEDTPGGCGAGKIVLGIYYDDVYARGYWTDENVVEISTADDQLRRPINFNTSSFTFYEQVNGAVARVYVSSTLPYDPAQGEDAQQLYFDDGVTLTMGLPVVAVGTDATGPYCAVKAPLAMPGNPATLANYGVGTLIGRRRYAGVVRQRDRSADHRIPSGTITLGPLSGAFDQAYGGYAIGQLQNVDVTTAALTFLQQFASRWPQLNVQASNFAALTGSTFYGTRADSSAGQMVTEAVNAVNTGDVWVVRVGHDRIPRMIRLYTSATNTHTYRVSLALGSSTFEPQQIQILDQDGSQLYNSIKVLGATNPATQQPYSAIVQDAASIALLGKQIDGAPVSVTSLTSDAACAQRARALLNQYSIGRSQGKFRVYVRNDGPADQLPQGLTNGDVVRGVQCVTVTGLDVLRSRNQVPDSEIALVVGQGALWQNNGFTYAPGVFGSSNGFRLVLNGTPSYATAPSYMVPVRRNDTWTLSGQLNNAGGTVSPLAQWAVYSPDMAVFLGAITAVSGANARPSKTIAIPPGYSYSSVILVAMGNGSIGSGTLDFCRPQFERAASASTYVATTGTPNSYGLASSVTTTIDFAGLDRYQDVTYAAVEPDWTSVMDEADNAVLTALLGNTGSSTTLAGYIVSASAFPPTTSTSSLTVGTPAFFAQFGATATPVAIAANAAAFTLPASATTWVWLNPNGTWTTQADSATKVAGAIPYGYFTTSAMGVLGFTPLASIGVYDSVLGAFSFAGMPASIQTNGPTVASVTIGSATTPGAGVTMVPLTIQIDAADYGGSFGAIPNWMDDLVVVMRKAVTHELLGDAEVMPPKANGTYNATIAIPAGVSVDVGCYWKSHKGVDFSAKTWPPGLFGLSSSLIAAGSIVGGGQKVNYVADAAFTHGLTYWKVVGDVPTVFPPQQTAGANPYPYVGFASGTGKNGTLYSKPFTPVPGQVYTLSCQAHGTSTGTVRYGIVDLSDSSAGHIPPTSIYGNGGALHAVPNANEYFTTYSWTCPTSGYPSQVCFAFTYTNASAPFLFQLAQIEPNAQATGFVNGPLTTNADGGGTLEHVSLPGSVTNNFDSGGNARRSSGLNTLPGILPVPSNFVLTFNFPSGSSSMTYWIGGGGVSGASVTFYLPDGTTFTAPSYYTSGAPNSYNAGATGQTVYALAYFSKSSNTWSVSFQTSAFSASAVAAAFADGYVALVASYTSAAALTGTTGSGSGGSARGGTGGRAAA